MAKNIGESVLARLKIVSKERGISMQALLRRYAQERLLYRLSISDERDKFCVKGGVLVTAYIRGNLLRPSEDIDFNGFLKNGTVETLSQAIEKIITGIHVDDGVEFQLSTMKVKAIRDGQTPGGKIALNAKIGTANVDLRVDVGFGNVITPSSKMIVMPTLLDGLVPSPEVLAYPLETVVAEKAAIIVEYGLVNTRLKDYFDLHMIAEANENSRPDLSEAIKNTFEYRETTIPEGDIPGLSEEFVEDNSMTWNAFLKKIDFKEKLP